MLRAVYLICFLLTGCIFKPQMDDGNQRIYELRRAHYATEAAHYCPNHVVLVRSEKFEKDFAAFNAISKQPGSKLRESYISFMQQSWFCARLVNDISSTPATFPHLRVK